MNAKELTETLKGWTNETRNKFQRGELEFSSARDVSNGVAVTVARLKDEPGKCVAVISTRRDGTGYRLIGAAIFDKPRELEFLPRMVAAAFIAATQEIPVAVHWHLEAADRDRASYGSN